MEEQESKDDVRESSHVYHERQTLQLCALHALNNLFQDSKAFSKAQLDEISRKLAPNTWLNPHKSFWGVGDYDVNVIMAALHKKGLKTIWFDKRRKIEEINLDEVYGCILNVPSNYKLLGLFGLPIGSGKHWIAMKKLDDGYYYDLDSKLEKPRRLGGAKDAMEFLAAELGEREKELLLVAQDKPE